MKVKRTLFVLSLLIFSMVCFQYMSTKYDPLARYKYTTPENRDIILEYINDPADIDYLIQQKIKPEEFMDYIRLEGFDVKNTLYYNVCRNTRNADLSYIINFINTYKKNFRYADLESLLKNYTYEQLEEFYNGAYTYVDNADLIVDPDKLDTTIAEKETLYKYVPSNLVQIDNSIIPCASSTTHNQIQVRQELIEPLKQMCAALEAENKQSFGGLILTKGYVSYDEQVTLYEQALLKHGYDKFSYYEDFPGQSEHQLGFTLVFTISSVEEDKIQESEQVKWLEKNAKNYGFALRYPKGAENKSGKYYQPLTLRYIGEEVTSPEFDVLDYFTNNK